MPKKDDLLKAMKINIQFSNYNFVSCNSMIVILFKNVLINSLILIFLFNIS